MGKLFDTNIKLNIEDIQNFDFPLDKPFSLEIIYNDVQYDFIINLSSNNKNLLCFGSGAFDRNEKNSKGEILKPPYYHRWSWYKYFDESFIAYADPIFYKNDIITLGWYIGDKNQWYLKIISEIIEKIAINQGIQNNNILFFGSSGGGFSSIALATIIKDSKALVNNCQFFALNFRPTHTNNLFDILNKEFEDLTKNEIIYLINYRLDLIELFKKEEYVPEITYYVNVNSHMDIHNQAIPFFKQLLDLPYFDDKLDFHLYHDENGHSPMDTDKTIKIIKEFAKNNLYNHNSYLEVNHISEKNFNEMNCKIDSSKNQESLDNNLYIGDLKENNILYSSYNKCDLSDKLISIIMPVFNTEKHIKKAIDSVINQSIGFNNLELICVDDASTDNSLNILKEYETYDNIKIISLEKNSGSGGKPRNVGLEHSSSKYIMFLDSDDYFAATACETLYNKINHSKYDIVFGGYTNIYSNGKEESVLPFKELDEELLFTNTCSDLDLVKVNPAISAKIFKKSLIVHNNITFPVGVPGQDLVFLLKALFSSNNVLSLNNYSVFYRLIRNNDGDKSISFNVTPKFILGLVKIYSQVLDICNEYEISKELTSMILANHLNYLSNLFLRANFSSNDLNLIFSSVIFKNFENHEFFNDTLFKEVFNNLKRGIYNNKYLFNFIEDSAKINNINNDLINLVEEFKLESRNVLSHSKKLESKNKELNLKLISIQNENNKLNKKLNEIYNSKSWKYTEIFRK